MKMTDEGNPLPPISSDTGRRAISALLVATAVGICLALVSLFLLDFLFILAFLLSVPIVRTVYRDGLPPYLGIRFIVTRWNHLIALGSCLAGGLWAAALREGLCFVIINSKLARLELFQQSSVDFIWQRQRYSGPPSFFYCPLWHLLAGFGILAGQRRNSLGSHILAPALPDILNPERTLPEREAGCHRPGRYAMAYRRDHGSSPGDKLLGSLAQANCTEPPA